MKKNKCLNCTNEFCFKPCAQLGKYCSNKCQFEYQYKQTIETWLNGGKVPGTRVLRKFFKEHQNHKCCICNLSTWCDKEIPLELDHINGNSEDNRMDNLRMICANCHTQTSTYKNKNRGNGRKVRRERYHKEKL